MGSQDAYERQHRKLKRVALAVLISAGAIVVMGQARPNRTFKADGFVLVDSSGKERARLTMEPDGPVLISYDASGKVRAALGVDPMAELSKEDREKVHEILRELGAPTPSIPGLHFFDEHQKELAQFGESGLILRGSEGKSVASLIEEEGLPCLNLQGKDGTEATVGATQILAKRSWIFRKEFYSMNTPEGFEILAGQGRPDGSVLDRRTASLLLFNENKKLAWSAP